MRASLLAGSIAASIASASAPAVTAPAPDTPILSWSALLTRARPSPTLTIPYGPDPLQVADLWLPAASRRAALTPTVLMVHGGCWTTAIADRSYMNWIAADLASRGIAVWNIEYRGVDKPGGGYPGTFRDAAAAADALRLQARLHRLDLAHLVAVGHSAGGHLGLWLAARPRLPARSPLRTAGQPMAIRAVVSLGGLPDLEQARAEPNGCGAEVIDKLVGPPALSSRDVYADTSLPRLAPIRVPQTLINGVRDRTVPPPFATAYAPRMRARGDRVDVRLVPGGHVDLVAPETAAWAAAVSAIEAALGRRAPAPAKSRPRPTN